MDATKGRKLLCPYSSPRKSRQGPGIVETTVYVVSGAIWPKRGPKGGGAKRVLGKGRKKRTPKEPTRAQKGPKGAQKEPKGVQKAPKSVQRPPKEPKGTKKRPNLAEQCVISRNFDRIRFRHRIQSRAREARID